MCEPSARTAWHTHPLGQTLNVTAGLQLGTEREGSPVKEIHGGRSLSLSLSLAAQYDPPQFHRTLPCPASALCQSGSSASVLQPATPAPPPCARSGPSPAMW